MVTEDNLKIFFNKAAASDAEVKRFLTLTEAADFVSRLAGTEKIQKLILSPDIRPLIQGRIESLIFEPGSIEDYREAEAGLVVADYGIAETGTLVHLDKTEEEKLVWTLPPVCLCILETGRIVPDLEAIAATFSAHLFRNDIPSPQVSLVTGPSRTADIECQLSIGVHGPRRLVILLVDEKAG